MPSKRNDIFRLFLTFFFITKTYELCNFSSIHIKENWHFERRFEFFFSLAVINSLSQNWLFSSMCSFYKKPAMAQRSEKKGNKDLHFKTHISFEFDVKSSKINENKTFLIKTFLMPWIYLEFLNIRREETWVKSVYFIPKRFHHPLRSSWVETHLTFFAYINKNKIFSNKQI